MAEASDLIDSKYLVCENVFQRPQPSGSVSRVARLGVAINRTHSRACEFVAESLIALVLATASTGAMALDLQWPVHSKTPPPVSQAFGEFGDGSSTKYHTGLDLAVPSGTDVFPVANGELVLVQRVSATADRGFGNSVILLHRAEGKPPFFSQYSHLSGINDSLMNKCKPDRSRDDVTLTCVGGASWSADDQMGRSGRSGFGVQEQPKYHDHLHLEIKSFGALCAPIANEPGCGYSTVQPWTIGYSDPINGLFGVRPFPIAFPVGVTGEGVSVRFTPDASSEKRAIATLNHDAANPVRAIAWTSGYPPCESEGWIQVQRVAEPICAGALGSSSCFADTLDRPLVVPNKYLGLVPTAWICAKYLLPEKAADGRRAVTEGILFSGGSVSVTPAGTKGLTVELTDRDGLFSVYQIPQLGIGAVTDLWSLIFLNIAFASPPYASFVENNRELTTALLARFAASCLTEPDAGRQAVCAVTRLATARRVRIGGGRYDEGQRCVGWRDKPTAKPECRPY